MKIGEFFFQNKKDEESILYGDKNNDFYISLEDAFKNVVNRYPQRIAIEDEYSHKMSFKELEEFSRKIALFIKSLDLGQGSCVAVFCRRNVFFVASILGIMRSGAVYLPLDPTYPFNRLEEMLKDSKAQLMFSESSLIKEARLLHYICSDLKHLVFLDVNDPGKVIEKPGNLMNLELWEHITAERSDNSWKSIFDGKLFSNKIMMDMAKNVVKKNQDLLHQKAKVIDIGSGSGIVAREILKNCGFYTAIDLSRYELDRIEALRFEYPHVKIKTHRFEAIDVSFLDENFYDLVVINSVIENFPGFNYLQNVLTKCFHLIKDGGGIFVGCVWDLDKKGDLLKALEEYGNKYGNWSGYLYIKEAEELFVPKDFFIEWAKDLGKEIKLEFSKPEIRSKEFYDYRFDVVIRKKKGYFIPSPAKERFLYGKTSITNQPFKELREKISPDTAAYVIYTSGSTGKPKGVVIEHKSLMNLGHSLFKKIYQPIWGEKPINISLVASFAFDASIQQLISCFIYGHTLFITSEDTRRDPEALHKFFEKNSIDLSDITPSFLTLMVDFWESNGLFSSVRVFIVGGEPLPKRLLDRFFKIKEHKKSILFNLYGPTECTVDTTIFSLDCSSNLPFDIVPIGKPLDNIVVSVRDKKGRILPRGIPGELWIGGIGVGRGYLNNPELTKKVFVKDKNIRWYKSGDLVRMLNDGNLFYIKRIDNQVKIRGNRLELEEVESALKKCPFIKDAVVLADEFKEDGGKDLVAYVISDGSVDVNSIKSYLSTLLPSYAIPSYFVFMKKFPLNVSGKIDKKNLPSPVEKFSDLQKQKGSPLKDEVEKKIALIWEDLLGVSVKYREADFFKLGGHSILAVKLVFRLEKEFGKKISLSKLFSNSTLYKLAEFITKDSQDFEKPYPIILLKNHQNSDMPPLFIFHPVGGHLLCYKHLVENLHSSIPIYGVESIAGEEDSKFPTVESMAENYFNFILSTVPQGPYLLAGWSFGGLLAFEVARLCIKNNISVKALILLDTVANTSKARLLLKEKDEIGLLVQLFKEYVDLDEEKIKSYVGKNRLEYLFELGVQHNILPDGFKMSDMKKLLRTFYVNTLATAKYHPSPLNIKGLLIRPEIVSSSTINVPDDPYQGWKEVLLKGVELKWIPGNHQSMLKPSMSKIVADIMNDYIFREIKNA